MLKLLLKIIIAAIVSASCIIWFFGSSLDQPSRFPSAVNVLNLSTALKSEIDSTVRKNPVITAVQIVTIHFPQNVKVGTYMSVDNVQLQEVYDSYVRNKVFETPLFDADSAINQRTLKLINGEFLCSPFSESTAHKYAPAAGAYIKWVCALGIPPYHNGEFLGILTIYLKDIPTKEETESLFLYSRDLSIKIYEENKLPLAR